MSLDWFAAGLHRCTVVARSLCVSYAYLFFRSVTLVCVFSQVAGRRRRCLAEGEAEMMSSDGWYYMLDVLVRLVLFVHLVYTLYRWYTAEHDDAALASGAGALDDNDQAVLTALDELFAELQHEMDQVTLRANLRPNRCRWRRGYC